LQDGSGRHGKHRRRGDPRPAGGGRRYSGALFLRRARARKITEAVLLATKTVAPMSAATADAVRERGKCGELKCRSIDRIPGSFGLGDAACGGR
jgi:hypothetical protein